MASLPVVHSFNFVVVALASIFSSLDFPSFRSNLPFRRGCKVGPEGQCRLLGHIRVDITQTFKVSLNGKFLKIFCVICPDVGLGSVTAVNVHKIKYCSIYYCSIYFIDCWHIWLPRKTCWHQHGPRTRSLEANKCIWNKFFHRRRDPNRKSGLLHPFATHSSSSSLFRTMPFLVTLHHNLLFVKQGFPC